MTRAVDLPETAEALREYRRGGVLALTAGILLSALGIACGVLGWGAAFAAVLLGLGATAVGAGVSAWPLERRFRRTLGAGAWSAHAAVAVRDDWKGETVVLVAADGEGRWPFQVFASRQRWTPVRPVAPGVLWWCGDPRVGGVLALPGGGPLFWARPLKKEDVRRRVLERAEEAGLAAVPEAALADPRPVRAPVAPGPASSPLVPAASWRKERRRRLTGRWRWLFVVSALVLALARTWTDASDADPQIDLTVVSEEADGSCVVRWTDPWDGRERTGPFRCDPERGAGLEDWETGFVVSYGPWKGELYGFQGDRYHGSAAWDTVEAVGLGSLGGLLVGLIGGWAGFWHRRSRLRRAAAEARPAEGAGR
ncbi:hypothetical protein ACH4OX_26960 [Streptomyces roseolus]|uniref:hypothetical protein n=1 Tax=Streptomyces roseolus TaxID=67358 RepID=UPI00378ABA28